MSKELVLTEYCCITIKTAFYKGIKLFLRNIELIAWDIKIVCANIKIVCANIKMRIFLSVKITWIL